MVSDIGTQIPQKPVPTSDGIFEKIDASTLVEEVTVDHIFFDRPAELPFVIQITNLFQDFLEDLGLTRPTAEAIANRFPTYYVYALNIEWRENSKAYRPLTEAVDTPFSRASEREFAWSTYTSLLQRRTQESVFDEPFSLKQIFINLNAYYVECLACKTSLQEGAKEGRRFVVISLREELLSWLKSDNKHDSIRVISGGPGSGKSSFAKIFASEISQTKRHKVIFVPLHLIDPTKEIADEVGRFTRDEGLLLANPLDADSPEPNLLIIFDGLDELASQGKAAAETARAFLREVERIVERRNSQNINLRVLISGRELIVQENESELRMPRQILTLLPYHEPNKGKRNFSIYNDGTEYHDPAGLLKKDLRHDWWINYGKLTGMNYSGLPKELDRLDLEEITAQPLLNYLVALSFTRNKLDFSKDINLNSIYEDLLCAVYERGYEKRRTYSPIKHIRVDDFIRILEEIGLAAWHGDGRSTTISEIHDHCKESGLSKLLEAFKEGAKVGVTRLLAAFFFRQHGQRPTGDPTFVFTHKSFGEYLTARRIVRAVSKIVRELEKREDDPDEGWDYKEALKQWVQICGHTAILQYLHDFILNEVRLQPIEVISSWQIHLAKLFSYMLKNGMPLDQMPHISPFKVAMFHARNAEEALLVLLNACARQTKVISKIEPAFPTSFAVWFKRIQGQRTGPDSVLAAYCLSYLDLRGSNFDMVDFYDADFSNSDLSNVEAYYACFGRALFVNANLKASHFNHATFESSNLSGANCLSSRFDRADLRGIVAKGINLKNATLTKSLIDNGTLSTYISELKHATQCIVDNDYISTKSRVAAKINKARNE